MRRGAETSGLTAGLEGGSSLRAQGSLRQDGGERLVVGFIPACAGEPAWPHCIVLSPWVHPCVRRGAIEAGRVLAMSTGSSLRAQGSRLMARGRHDSHGFIPACAGEPSRRRLASWIDKVHPCVRRGAHPPDLQSRPARGSSLRAQGSRPDVPERALRGGFIPACAGEPPSIRGTTSGRRVHPCVRRGASVPMAAAAHDGGSSLRAQGSPNANEGEEIPAGFIPACAGEPSPEWRRAFRCRVHPCVRRGALRSWGDCRNAGGSSLRAQGSRHVQVVSGNHVGFIPACAGEPSLSSPSRIY